MLPAIFGILSMPLLNVAFAKETQTMLYQTLQNGELRRTLGDRQADSGAVVHSLKQKILKLEMQMREKESAYW